MMDKISIDFIIFLVIVFTAFSGYRRGLFKEFMVAIAYVPYIAAMFYIVNEFIQGTYSFDSMLLKVSAIGGFYIAYLIAIWLLGKALKYKLEIEDITINVATKVIASVLSALRTVYFCILCLMMFNLHINKPEMLEKSKLATAAQPFALKVQDYLLEKGYLNNAITLYEDAMNGTIDENGKYEHPLLKKIKSSSKFKEMEEQINSSGLKNKMNRYIEQQY